MPWEIRERDGRHCVVNKDTGKVEKCHDDKQDALAHMRALYHAVKEKELSAEEWEEAMRQAMGSE